MKQFTLRAALPVALLFVAPALAAQTRPDSTKRSKPTKAPVVRDSAAGKLDLKRDSLSMKRDSLAMKRDSLAMKKDSLDIKKDSVDATAQFGRLIAALSTIDVNTARFTGITGLKPEQITLVDVRNLLRGDNQQALEQALGKSEAQLTGMRNALQNSMVLRDLLVAKDMPMAQVIAVDVSADGSSATVFYRPQE